MDDSAPAATASDDNPTDGPGDSAGMIDHSRRDDGVHVITLTNAKVNALCADLLHQLRDVAQQVATETPRAVVVTGGPKVFAAGADITEFAQRSGEAPFALADSLQVTRLGDAFLTALNAVAAVPCPSIAAVNGFALGGGCELALACDFRVASAGARFGQPEILLGIIPGGGGTQRLARLVGPSRAKDLVFTGRMIGVEEAQHIGLVDRVVDGDAMDEALEMAVQFAAGPTAATSLAKRAIDGGLDGSLEAGLVLEQHRFVESFTTRDAEVGVASFIENGPGHARFHSD